MIEVIERIEVQAPPRVVWDVLSDPHAVVECVPGAGLGEKQEDGSYDATLTVKFGPAKVAFRARFTLELDPATMSGKVASRARDNQGGTRVKTRMAFSVVEGQTPGSSAIPIEAQVEIGGKLASLVESGANIVVKQMTKEFTERLAARLAGAAVAAGDSDESRAMSPRWNAVQVHAQPPGSHLQRFLGELWAAVKTQTGGRLDVAVHPLSMGIAGGGPNVLKKVLSGEIAFHVFMGPGLAHAVPAMEIQGLPFAFAASEQVAAAMDGELGEYLAGEMAAKGLHAFPRGLMENGFRQIVSAKRPVRNADDLAGYRMRVPEGRIFTDLFESLGAVPVTLSIDRLYGALRDGAVDGQENPLVVAEELKLYEVAGCVSTTNHVWSGFNLYGNLAFWNALPGDVQDIVSRNVAQFVAAQRAHVRELNRELEGRLAGRGMKFNVADTAGIRGRLAGGFYARWKTQLGATAWSLLERTTGQLG